MSDLIPMFGIALLAGLAGYFIGCQEGYKRAETFYRGLLVETHNKYFQQGLERLKRTFTPTPPADKGVGDGG